MARLSGHGAEPRQLTSPPLAHATLTRHSHTPFRGLPYAVTNRLQQPCSNGYDHSAHAPHASTGARAVRRRSRIPRPTLAHDGLPARCVHLPREPAPAVLGHGAEGTSCPRPGPARPAERPLYHGPR